MRVSVAAAGLPGRYAAALFDLAESAGSLDAVAADLGRLQRAVAESADLAALLTAYPRARAWFSFTLRDSEHLSDGTPLRDVVSALENYPQVVALGINCIALENTTSALTHLHSLTSLPLVVYPNSGEHYDAVSKTWHHHGEACETLAGYLPQWLAAGAKLIGGCCRTTPKDIAALTVQR